MPFLPAKISVIWMEFTILIAHKKTPTKLDRVIAIWHNISVKKCHPKWNYSRIQQWLIWSIMNPGLHKGRSELLQTNEQQFPTSFCAFGKKKKKILPSIQQKTKVELERCFFFFSSSCGNAHLDALFSPWITCKMDLCQTAICMLLITTN